MVPNCSPAVMTPTRQSTMSATTRPRLRPTEDPSRKPAIPVRSWPVPDSGSWATAVSWGALWVASSGSCVTLRFLP